MEINGKTALVLGAAKGIGKAVGRALAEAGARLILTYYDWPEDARLMQQEFSDLGCEFLAVKVDLRDSHQIERLFSEIKTKFSTLDILINGNHPESKMVCLQSGASSSQGIR